MSAIAVLTYNANNKEFLQFNQSYLTCYLTIIICMDDKMRKDRLRLRTFSTITNRFYNYTRIIELQVQEVEEEQRKLYLHNKSDLRDSDIQQYRHG